MWLLKCLKTLVLEHLATAKRLKSLKTCTTAVTSNCFITLEKIELENVRLSGSKILGVFVNRSTADDKYCPRIRKNLWLAIQRQLPKKQKSFSSFSAVYLKSTSNFEHFEKKDDPQSLCIFEMRDCERCG